MLTRNALNGGKQTKNQVLEKCNYSLRKKVQNKLIRQQQIILILTLAYVELLDSSSFRNVKIISSLKNIMINIHKNYLVFVEFICKNLTNEQRSKTKEWVDELYHILQDRPAAKTYYRSNNTQTLIRNNEISVSLLKNLLRTNQDQND